MKTIKTTSANSSHWSNVPVGTLLRMRDEDAKKVVDDHNAKYVPKEEWKKQRDKKETNETNKEASNAENQST